MEERKSKGKSVKILLHLCPLSKTGMSVITFEGNMADEREFDEARTARMIDLFVTATLGPKKVA